MSRTEIGVNSAAFFPFNLFGVSWARMGSNLCGYDKNLFEYMPAYADAEWIPEAPRQHVSWRQAEKNLPYVLSTIRKGPASFALSSATYCGMPMSQESLSYLNTSRHTVIYPGQEYLAKNSGFSDISIQPTTETKDELEKICQRGIRLVVDTQHTKLQTFETVITHFKDWVSECHIRCAPDVSGWKNDLKHLTNGELGYGPLSMVAELPAQTPLVSEVSMIAVASCGLMEMIKNYKLINENIRKAARKRN